MAYGTKYYFEASGLRESVYRAQLEREGYTGSASDVTRDMGSIVFQSGKEGLNPTEGIQPSRAQITVRDQSLVEEVYGEGDRAWRATIKRKATGGSYSGGYFQGYILGDMGKFDPGAVHGPAQFEAVDGLELLKNIDYGAISGGEANIAVWQLINAALVELDLDFDFWLQFPWFYRLEQTSDSELDATDEKLKHLKVKESALQKDRGQEGDEARLRNHYDVLRNALRSLSLRLVQSQGEWWVRQRHVGRYGSTPAHLYTPGSGTKNQTTSKDLVWDISQKGGVVEERPSKWQRNVGLVRKTHDFGPYQGTGLKNGDLESLDGWTLIEDEDDQYYVTDVINHDDRDYTPDATANNEQFVETNYTFTLGDFQNNYLRSDVFSFQSSTRRDEVFVLNFNGGINVRSDRAIPAVEVKHAGYYLDDKNTEIVGKQKKGENVILPTKPLEAPIPKGTVCVIKENDDQGGLMKPSSTIKLTKRAEPGDNRVVGNLSKDVDPSNYSNDYPILRYYAWHDGDRAARYDTLVRSSDTLPGATWQEVEIIAPMVLDQASGGGVVEGDTIQITFCFLDTGSIGDDANLLHSVDQISVDLTVGGASVSKEVFETDAGVNQSREEDIVSYLGDGPGPDSKARFFYRNAGTGNEQQFLDEWDLYPFTGQGGQRLGFLQGQEFLRELREKHKRRKLSVHVQSHDQVFGPHHILKWNGQLWSIENYQFTPDDGRIDVEVLPVTDDGTSGFTQRTALVTDDQGEGDTAESIGGGSSAGVPADTDDWSNIAGGIGDGLFVNSDGELGVEIASDSFLKFENGILKGEVKDEDDLASNSDQHLATQQSIKQYVDTGGEAAKDLARELVQTQADIDALDAVTVRESRSITAKGEVNRINVWTAENVDGALTKDLVLAFSTPQDIHAGAEFQVTSLRVNKATKPSDGQIALAAQADESDEAVRADRTVEVAGTTNQILVDTDNTTQGALTQDISITLEAPQDLHPDAEFQVKSLRVGNVNKPTDGQIALAQQADETDEAVRADRTVNVKGTNNQINVNNAAQDLTDDPSFTVSAPQNLHTGADFRIDKLRVGTDTSPANPGGANLTGIVKHPDFVDGFTGAQWRVKPNGSIGAGDLFLRGTLTVSELIVNRIHAVDGTQIIGPGRGRIKSISGSAPTETITFEDPNGNGVTSFAAGDLVIVQEVDVDNSTIVKRIVREVDSVDNTNAQVTLREHTDSNYPGDSGALAQGDTVVVFGHISDPDRQNVLVATATNPDAPYRRTLAGIDSWTAWQSSDKAKTQAGNIDALSPDNPGFGFYGESVRMTKDVIIGDLDAATSNLTGGYLRYDGSTFEVILSNGENVENTLNLLARRITQEQESRAAIELITGENSARIEANAKIIGDDSLFSQSTLSLHASETETRFTSSVQFSDSGTDVNNRSQISLIAGPNGSDAILAGENIILDGDTEVLGAFTVTDTNIDPDYALSGDTSIVFRQDQEPTERPSGANLRDGDIWIETDENNRVRIYNASNDDWPLAEDQNTVVTTFRQNSEPTNTDAQNKVGRDLIDGDIWIDTDDADNVHQYDASNSSWVEAGNATITIRATDPPGSRPDGSNLKKGDQWIETDEGNRVWTWDGTEWNQIEANLRTQVSDNESNIDLIAKRMTQEREARAAVELTVSEARATLELSVKYDDNQSSLTLNADANGSEVTLDAEQVLIDGTVTATQTSFEPGAVTIRATDEPQFRDSGDPVQKGDVWIDTSDGDKPYTYDGTDPYADSGWVASYTTISGGNITTGTITGPGGEFSINLDSGDFLLSQGSIADEVTIGGVGAEQIRRGGTVFQAGMENEGSDWDEGGNTTYLATSSTVWTGGFAAVIYSNDSTSIGSGGQPGLHTEIPEEIAIEFAGRTVEVTVWAKENSASEFAVSYSTADAGNSGWQRFSPTASWQSYRFTYDVPDPGTGGTDFLGILGDADGNGDSTYIDRVTVRPQTQRVSGFEIGSERIERFTSGGSLDTAIGKDLQDVDGPSRALLGEYSGDPVVKVVGGGGKSTDYVVANGTTDGTMFEVASGGNTIFKVQDGGANNPDIFIDNLGLKDLTIEGTLTMGTSGQIVNNASPTDYRLDEDGLTLTAGDPDTGPLARRVNWEENGSEIFYIAADNGSMESIVTGEEASGYSGMTWYAKAYNDSSGAIDRMRISMNYRPTGSDDIEMLVTNTEGYYTNDYPEIKLGHMVNTDTSTNPRAFNFYPNTGLMHFQNPRTSDPASSVVQDICADGEFVLYAYEESNGDVRFKYAERKPDGSVDYKTIQD